MAGELRFCTCKVLYGMKIFMDGRKEKLTHDLRYPAARGSPFLKVILCIIDIFHLHTPVYSLARCPRAPVVHRTVGLCCENVITSMMLPKSRQGRSTLFAV